MTITLVVCAAIILDYWLGEPRRFHPLVGFGGLVQLTEQHIYSDSTIRGIIALLLILVPFIFLATLVHFLSWNIYVDILLLYLTIGWNSLGEHARRVHGALASNNVNEARKHVGFIVSRDTTSLSSTEITRGAIESVLENGNDAIFGTVFWFVIAGIPGAIAYRLINTLDAMWGYRNSRYLHFGWAAARLDDVFNFIPARLTALSYALTGCTNSALECWRTQGPVWKSPNAGPVMAAGAGSLGILLGGPARYHNEPELRSLLGKGRIPVADDINLALGLILRSIILWVLVICLGEWFVESFITV